MISSILIILVSLVLLAYWFRYTCLLVLRNRSGATVETPAMAFSECRALLESGQPVSLAALDSALHRDYSLLNYLFDHAPALELNPIERRLLTMDYSLLRMVFHLTRSISPEFARGLLTEMSSIVSFFADRAGERAVSQARA